jgi:hypothetical protein
LCRANTGAGDQDLRHGPAVSSREGGCRPSEFLDN